MLSSIPFMTPTLLIKPGEEEFYNVSYRLQSQHHRPVEAYSSYWAIMSLNLRAKSISFLLHYVWLAEPLCSLFSHYKIDNTLCHSGVKVNEMSRFDWPCLKWAAAHLLVCHSVIYSSYFITAPQMYFCLCSPNDNRCDIIYMSSQCKNFQPAFTLHLD